MHTSLHESMHGARTRDQSPLVVDAGASPELQDLVAGMLCKNPAQRLQWPQLCGHPFWHAHLPLLPLPPQPDFEAFLAAHAEPEDLQPHLAEVCKCTDVFWA